MTHPLLHKILLALLIAGLLSACDPGDDDDDTAATDDDVGDDDTTASHLSEVSWRLHETIGTLVYVSWTQAAAASAWVEYSFDEGEWLSTPVADRGAGVHEVLLLGIPFETSVTFRVASDPGSGAETSEDQVADTGALPVDLPVPELIASDPSAYEPTGTYLLGSINAFNGGWTGGEYHKFIMDRQGRFVWHQITPDNNWTIYSRVSLNGHDLLFDEFTYWSAWDEGENSHVLRMKIDGSLVDSYHVPGGHHAFTELPDGSIAWGAAGWSSETLDILRPDGTHEVLWDCREFEDAWGGGGYCQSNTLYYSEERDTFLYSFYTSDTIVEIDHATGTTVRHWGHINGAWEFDPPESAFYWQHGVNYTDTGTLLTSTYVDSWNSELVAREYELDEDTEVLRQVWSFGEGEGVSGDTAGEVHRLPGGNTLHNYGDGNRLREVTPDGTVVWDVDWDGSKLLGRAVFIEDLYAFLPGEDS
jgi:hypothetical protein